MTQPPDKLEKKTIRRILIEFDFAPTDDDSNLERFQEAEAQLKAYFRQEMLDLIDRLEITETSPDLELLIGYINATRIRSAVKGKYGEGKDE